MRDLRFKIGDKVVMFQVVDESSGHSPVSPQGEFKKLIDEGTILTIKRLTHSSYDYQTCDDDENTYILWDVELRPVFTTWKERLGGEKNGNNN